MSKQSMTILVTGATGSIGSLVVDEALRQGHSVHALVRSPEKARRLPAQAESVIGDLTRPDTLLQLRSKTLTLSSSRTGRMVRGRPAQRPSITAQVFI